MDRLTSLNAFVQSAETRSFAAASRHLGVSPSAVGKSVSRLEDRLGVRLFHRNTRSIALTSEGGLFLSRCLKIFGEIEAAELEMAQATGSACGRLRVGLPLIGLQFTGALSGFAKAYPDVDLDLDFTDRTVDVIEEGFDIVLRTGDVSDSRLMTKAIGSYDMTIVGSPEYLERRGVPGTPEDLRQHACLHHRSPTTGRLDRWPLLRDGVSIALELPIATVASAIEPLVGMATQGLGLACVPRFTVAQALADGRLQSVLEEHLGGVGVFRLLWPSSRHLSPKIKAFVDFMAVRVGNLDPLGIERIPRMPRMAVAVPAYG